MAESAKSGEELYTLTEVSNLTGISMPTLQRYKKEYQSRIPSVGKGRKQRYKKESLEVFQQIKEENISKRGRPKKAASAKRKTKSTRGRKATGGGGGRAKKAEAPSSDGLLTLKEISDRTGISYPTLSRYVKLYPNKLKFEGSGRKRRYHEDSIPVFEELRATSKRGPSAGGKKASTGGRGRQAGGRRKAAASGSGSDTALENRIKTLEKQVKDLERRLSKSVKVVIPPR